MDNKFSVKWSEFKKIREEGRLCDVTLATADGKYLQAHKVILSAGSKFFNDVFINCNSSNLQMMIYLKGIKNDELKNILDFIYNGEVCLPEDQQSIFLETARGLLIKGIDRELPVIANTTEKTESINIKSENFILTSSGDPESPDGSTERFKSIKTQDELNSEIKQMIQKNEGGLWSCQLCGKTMDTNSAIRDHAERHIAGMKHDCHLCNKTFSSRPNLRSHIAHMHKGLFDCDKCEKSGMNWGTSQYHKKRYHSSTVVKHE